jgi:hypothetical protein
VLTPRFFGLACVFGRLVDDTDDCMLADVALGDSRLELDTDGAGEGFVDPKFFLTSPRIRSIS